MYSVAIGEHKGPAADVRAEAQLHGQKPPSEVTTKAKAIRAQGHNTPKDARKLALEALKKLFSKARGILERGEQRRRVQRAKLRAGLRSTLAEEALNHGRDTQIVGLLLSFIGRLLDSGGPRKSLLAPSSIEKYFGAIAKELIEHAWDFDFESAESDELLELFNTVSEKVDSDSRELVLRLFYNHLRDELSIPLLHRRWFNPREPVRVRSSLVFPDDVTKAIGWLKKQPDEETARNAAYFIALCNGYGLRRLEAIGLTEDRFDTGDETLHLMVKKTPIADSKSIAGRRVICGTINRKSVNDHLLQAITLARTSSRKKGFLFESSTREDHIAPARPITSIATEALRQASGTLSVVPHTLRHSYATILGLGLFAQSDRGTLRELEVLKIFHRPGIKEINLDDALRVPNDWPFGVDAIATALGHADSSTFLNVYFHGSHLVIAEHADDWQPKKITQVRLATMLNKERTKLSKLGKKLHGKSTKIPFDPMAVVHALVERENRSTGSLEADLSNADATPTAPGSWHLFVHALQYRQEQNLSLQGMKSYATEGLSFANDTVDRFAHAYQRLVGETALDDFEPASSELIIPVSSHREGVARGTAERKDFIASGQEWTISAEANFTRLRQFIDNWQARVKATKPTIVCQSMAELEESLEILQALGADPDQLDLRLHGDVSSSWLSGVQLRYPNAAIFNTRASRGNSRVKVAEVSISVGQQRNTCIPDGRDLHRAFVGLYVALHAQDLTTTL